MPDIRLSGGSTDNEGTVEVYYNDKWVAICDRGWTDVEAMVVCTSLGFE